MLEEPNSFIEFDKNLENSYINSVSLDMLQNKEHCYTEEISLSNKEEYFVKQKKFQFVEMQDITNENDPTSTFNKTSRTVPNILKNKSKLHRISKSLDVTNAAISEQILCENILLKRKTKHKDVSCKRKQKFSSVDTCQELPKLDICSFVDDEHEIWDKHLFTSTKYRKKCSRRKRSKRCVKKCYRKRKTSVDVNQSEKNLLCSVSHEVSTDYTSEYNAFSPLEEIESGSFQDSIDFTSNEIFNKFNYEFYNNNNSNLDCFTWDTMDSDETRNSLSTTYESEKEYDINGNEVNTYDLMECWPLTGNKQDKRSTSPSKFYWDEEYWDEDTDINDNTGIKDRLLTETVDDDSEDDLNNYHLHMTESVEYLNDSTLNEYNDKNKCSSVIDTVCLPYEDDISSPLMDFISYSNGKIIETEMFHETRNNQEDNIVNDSSNETDSGGEFLMSENQGEDLYSLCTSQIPENNGHSTNKKMFQCLLCLLTFSNARTMAMHQADAHGDTYTILCEICGRLFNRKYHFNRHFTYCGSKNPFKCHMCVKKYRHKSSLVYHLKLVHDVDYILNDLKKFTCNLCKKVYSRFGSFENHIIKYHENTSDLDH
ncbi:uncharacterized protein LOC143433271 [Xylocopa sonorina]|uniref:uncharacterized protein LOC143433271 n=1 Tax=Xylocopa sonorina TaxID=1818115 RepID=UPI00403AB80E